MTALEEYGSEVLEVLESITLERRTEIVNAVKKLTGVGGHPSTEQSPLFRVAYNSTNETD